MLAELRAESRGLPWAAPVRLSLSVPGPAGRVPAVSRPCLSRVPAVFRPCPSHARHRSSGPGAACALCRPRSQPPPAAARSAGAGYSGEGPPHSRRQERSPAPDTAQHVNDMLTPPPPAKPACLLSLLPGPGALCRRTNSFCLDSTLGGAAAPAVSEQRALFSQPL